MFRSFMTAKCLQKTLLFVFQQKLGSVITIVMDMNNICIPLIIQSSASDSQLGCPWLICCLDSAGMVNFDVRTLPPADSPLYNSDSLDKWVTADMWPGVTWTPQNNLPQLWQAFISVLFILMPQLWLFVCFFYLQVYCISFFLFFLPWACFRFGFSN